MIGEVVMTLTDQLKRRQWSDVVNIHYSNHDIKGKGGADWVQIGLLPPNLEIEIPYRMLIPKHLEGILVVGKAISATHDALPAIRMQADLENLGGIAALAAAQNVRSETEPRHIDVRLLQQSIVAAGLLPAEIIGRTIKPKLLSEPELEQLVERMDADTPLYEYSNMSMGEMFTESIPFVEICTAGTKAIPILARALRHSEGEKKIRVAQALAMLESREAVPVLIEEIMRRLSGQSLPTRTNRIRHSSHMPPNQAAMPDVVYLVYALGIVPDVRNISVWTRIADLMCVTEDDIRDQRQGVFYYVDAVCYGAERLGDPGAIPALRKLHSQPPLHRLVCTSGFQADYALERQAMLELAIGRALARCGDKAGFSIVIDYLGDVRGLLAEQAHRELKDISGQDYGKCKERCRLCHLYHIDGWSHRAALCYQLHCRQIRLTGHGKSACGGTVSPRRTG